ncbi:DUF4198 domain-containing protein [Diaphorobacter nitroreducens]|uniref:DUF4198 domain-containing protein n=1 Tax=Diaphorobacter nitroreducens TaxID=164759 RepID=UPI0035B2DBF9
MKKALTAITFAAAALTAQAHHVWIEQDTKGATLYFGEFGDNLREASPGLLDKFVSPTAQHLSARGERALTPARNASGFALGIRAAKGESIVAEETTYPISENKQGDKVTRSLYQPAARLVTDFSAQKPRLTLDLVPTGKSGKDGVEFQAFYKGQPLPKAKVELVNSSGWAQGHETDAEGKVIARLPWKGTYVLELSHRDTTGGERTGGEKWERASYVTSLTVLQSTGLAALPVPPAAAPNKAN